MSETILNDWNPDDDTLLRWAYTPEDAEILLDAQDEDLVLHRTGYVPLLLRFAADPACPKQDYCLSILTDYTQEQLLYRQVAGVEAIENACAAYAGPLPETVLNWMRQFRQHRQRLIDPQPMTADEARQLAFELAAANTARAFSKVRTLPDGYIEYLASTESYRLYVYVHPATGIWTHSHYHPVENVTQARINGRLLERLRNSNGLAVSKLTPEPYLQTLLGLPVTTAQFWRAVADLEQARELTRTVSRLIYCPPADRW